MNTLGTKIAELRKLRDMTQEELSAQIGVSPQTVSKWETGATCPDILLLPILADIFGVTLDELFGKPHAAQSLSFEDVPETAYNALLMTMWGATGDCTPDGVAAVGQRLKENPHVQSALYSEKGGAVFATSEYGVVLREGCSTGILSDPAAAKVLDVLDNPVVRTLLVYQADDIHGNVAYTVASAAKRCGLDEAAVGEALERLEEIGLTCRQDVDLGEEIVRIYHPYAGHRMLLVRMIFHLAARLGDYWESYAGFHGTPMWGC